ncbi:MAG: hypothetical protein OES84_06280, partial [Kiritimatiellaceae bacterium]|nr:hypothetical protein [Kiritimatiellaceae bacterium]
MSNKKGYFGQHAKSSAVFVSLIIHAVLIVVAISFVAVRVYVKEEKIFEVKKGIRPQMKLIKLRLPANVKKRKNPAPKLRENFVSKPKTKSMNIALPKMVGIKGSMDHLDEGGLGGIDFGLDLDLFGGDKGSGNEFQGTFFDLKMNPDGEPGKMDEQIYLDVLRSFANSWNISRFSKRYFKAPKNKFATTFMLPKMSAEEAPKAYGVENVVKPKLWAVYYTGQIAAPETGRYRFWGIADNVLMVRVKKRLVIDANWPGMN